jgi:hypothetical protein
VYCARWAVADAVGAGDAASEAVKGREIWTRRTMYILEGRKGDHHDSHHPIC